MKLDVTVILIRFQALYSSVYLKTQCMTNESKKTRYIYLLQFPNWGRAVFFQCN